jgi:hypothetical protein
MITLVIVLWQINGFGILNGISTVAVPGFATDEACRKAGTEITANLQTRLRTVHAATYCVQIGETP